MKFRVAGAKNDLCAFVCFRTSISHNVYGSPVHPGCAEGGRVVQLPLYDKASLHLRDEAEQQRPTLRAR